MLQIRADLMSVMGIYAEHTSDSLRTEQAKDVHVEFGKWLQDLKLECFAEFTTVRCSYALENDGDDRRVRVDLDQADFGYCVGEIEVLVSEEDEMPFAVQTIEKMAQKIGDWKVFQCVDKCLYNILYRNNQQSMNIAVVQITL